MNEERPVRKVGIRRHWVSAADVARALGVSPATVSYALNGRPGVSAQMRDLIIEQAQKMGYPVDAMLARGDASPTRVLGLVLADLGNPFYSDIAAGVVDAARGHGYEVFLTQTQDDSQTLASVVSAMLTRRVDGLLLTVLHLDDGDVIRSVRRTGTPFVQLSRRIPDVQADFFGIDDELASREILSHVVQVHGYRDIAVVTGPAESSASAARASAFLRAARAHGVDIPVTQRFTTPLNAAGGHRLVDHLVRSRHLPRVIVCGSDAVASGVMGALRSHGLRVPAQVAVTGFDGVFPDASILAELTTVSVPRRPMASAAVDRLVRRIDGHGGRPGKFIQPHSLRIGTTCGCPVTPRVPVRSPV